jgi:predicted N-acetyltransferase YhbS
LTTRGELSIEKLRREHEVDAFDCGEEALNRYLVRHALANQLAGSSQTYVALDDGATVVGFYTLTVGQVEYGDAPERLVKGMPRYPVPIMILARLAVAIAAQGRGLGAGLLRDAMLRTIQAADIAGIRAFVTHAKNDPARAFYEHFDFVPLATDPYHLYCLIKDIRRLTGERPTEE